MDYGNIIESSTANFQKRHLILDEQKRYEVKRMCENKLGSSSRVVFTNNYGDTFRCTIYDACHEYAKRRLRELRDKGDFRTDFNDNASYRQRFSKIQTMIISDTMLLYIKQGHGGNGDLRFEIKETRNLEDHLVKKYAHFKY